MSRMNRMKNETAAFLVLNYPVYPVHPVGICVYLSPSVVT
jgi:nitrate reductase NapE component